MDFVHPERASAFRNALVWSLSLAFTLATNCYPAEYHDEIPELVLTEVDEVAPEIDQEILAGLLGTNSKWVSRYRVVKVDASALVIDRNQAHEHPSRTTWLQGQSIRISPFPDTSEIYINVYIDLISLRGDSPLLVWGWAGETELVTRPYHAIFVLQEDQLNGGNLSAPDRGWIEFERINDQYFLISERHKPGSPEARALRSDEPFCIATKYPEETESRARNFDACQEPSE